MAKCEKQEIKAEPPPVEFVLTLSAHEAAVLSDVLSGSRQFDCKTRDDIYWALRKAECS